ncbi:hypothetical protein B0J11DRAFT_530529 [Dendryphion nanum]|uniref:Uncharacterized protein n=1 Tax=Dendryphion nanum TaxID=256645 RepID=A0A9P9DNS8_9PLEO|nr:hypothetical protein B0J11DRAFT_530529 [Dendryphion nanum]
MTCWCCGALMIKFAGSYPLPSLSISSRTDGDTPFTLEPFRHFQNGIRFISNPPQSRFIMYGFQIADGVSLDLQFWGSGVVALDKTAVRIIEVIRVSIEGINLVIGGGV